MKVDEDYHYIDPNHVNPDPNTGALNNDEYRQWLNELKQRISHSQVKASFCVISKNIRSKNNPIGIKYR